MRYQDINSKTIDKWVEEGWEWGTPINHEEFLKAKNGQWNILLTPTVFVPHEWLGDVKGKKILGLACGGAQQMPIMTALGAQCTVLDYSLKQLESEKEVAKRENYNINIVHADMTKPLPFEDEEFDIIIHPVSNVYIEDVHSLFKECARVVKKGGVLIAGLSNEINYFVSEDEKQIQFKMPFNPLVNEDHLKILVDNDCGYQFSHTTADQIGGQLKAGFIIEDIFDDINEEGYLREMNIKTFFATKAIKK